MSRIMGTDNRDASGYIFRKVYSAKLYRISNAISEESRDCQDCLRGAVSRESKPASSSFATTARYTLADVSGDVVRRCRQDAASPEDHLTEIIAKHCSPC